MKELITRVLGSFRLDLNEHDTRGPLCMEEHVLRVSGRDPSTGEANIVAIFGQCTKDPSKWHAFLFGVDDPDHILRDLPAQIETVKNKPVATFDPAEVKEEHLRSFFSKMEGITGVKFLYGVGIEVGGKSSVINRP